jgi:hypothetical protein
MKTLASFILISLLSLSASASPLLIGGGPAKEEEFRSSVFINQSCTGSKIGARTFLFAAHCMINGNSGDLSKSFHSGASVNLRSHYGAKKNLKIEKAFPHPTYVSEIKRRLQMGVATTAAAFVSYDIALFTVTEDSPEFPVAMVEYDEVVTGEEVVIGGWGCEISTHDASPVNRYKIATSLVINSDQLTDYYKRDFSQANVFNFYSEGIKANASAASICPGDSGGAAYRKNSEAVVGVNSQYLFSDNSGISTVNTHTRLSAVAEWAQEIVK